jgi:hypothetical protein
MKKRPSLDNQFTSDLSKKAFSLSQKVAAHTISESFLKFIQAEHPNFTDHNYLSLGELSALRVQFISSKLQCQLGELSSMEKLVLDTLSDGDVISNLAMSQDTTS